MTNANATPDYILVMPDYLVAALAAGLSPYHHGRLTHLAGLPCTPDEYLMDGNRAEYEQGYYEEAGDRFAAMVKAMVGDEDYERLIDHIEYVDDMEDRQWHAGGGW